MTKAKAILELAAAMRELATAIRMMPRSVTYYDARHNHIGGGGTTSTWNGVTSGGGSGFY
jgi:hypothetical protein